MVFLSLITDTSFYAVWILKKTKHFILTEKEYFEIAVVIDLDNLPSNGKWTV